MPFDIFAFYRGMHTYVGIDSIALTAVDCAPIFEALTPGFEDGTLKPFAVAAGRRSSRSSRPTTPIARCSPEAPERLAFVPISR